MEFWAIVAAFAVGVATNAFVIWFWDWSRTPSLRIDLYCNVYPSQGRTEWKQLGIELRLVPKRWARWLLPNPVYGCWGTYRVSPSSLDGLTGREFELQWNSEIAVFDGRAAAQNLKRYQLNVHPGMNVKLARAVIASKMEGNDHFVLHSDREEQTSSKEIQVIATIHYASSKRVTRQSTIRNSDCHCDSFTWVDRA